MSIPPLGRASVDTSSFTDGPLRLDVRSVVAVRRVSAREQTLYYLSLFDDEIDSRLEEFLAFRPTTTWNEQALVSAALALEPTDAVVIACRHERILVARGGACNFPLYWTQRDRSILISTTLPVDRARRLSRVGLLVSVAVVSIANQNEPNVSARTPLEGWFRCRRGAVSVMSTSAGCVLERAVDMAESDDTDHDRDQLIEALRSALNKFGRRQLNHPRAFVELSGGFDSTIAAIAARTHGIELIGVSEHFPYYEFRFEEGIQKAVANAFGISRIRLDGTNLLAFAPSDWWPRLDEPAIAIIRLKRAVAVARLVSNESLDRVFVGHGGDQLFAENILDRETAPYPLARGAFSKAAWLEIERILSIREEANSSFLKRSSLIFSYDARFDVVLKEAFGTTTRSPFTDLGIVRCGLAWAKLSARLGITPGKSFLAETFAAKLPDASNEPQG